MITHTPYLQRYFHGEYEQVWSELRAFVEYLRTCFRWAGFPGLAQAPKPPLDEIAILTRSLLPL